MNLQESVDKLASSVLEALKKRDEGTLEERHDIFTDTLNDMLTEDWERERIEAERPDETPHERAEQQRDTAADIELEQRLEAGHGIE